MKVGGSIVVSPADNPCQFDPDWRASAARALVSSGLSPASLPMEYRRYSSDRHLRCQCLYLRAASGSGRMTEQLMPYRLADVWFRGTDPSDAKFRIEPLLLTAADYRTIALDITGDAEDVDAVEAYEKVYFNIRDSEGRLSRSCQLRQYFAMPSGIVDDGTPPWVLWKMVGALFGYDMLMNVWMWKDAHGLANTTQEYILDEMWRVAQSRLFMSMFANRVGHESMAKLLASISAQQKLIQDSRASESGDLGVLQMLLGLLAKTNPVMIDSTASEVDANAAVMSAVAARLEAEKAVSEFDLGSPRKDGTALLQGPDASGDTR